MEGFDYRMFQTGDDQGGAVMPSETPGLGPIVYFDTDDIDASIAKVRELGGTGRRQAAGPDARLVRRAARTPRATSFSLWQATTSSAA